MHYSEYNRIKDGKCQSVGSFGNAIYAYEVLIGACNIPEYYQITKDKFDTFDEWKGQTPTDLGIVYDIVNRVPLCSGYRGKTEILQIGKELRCPK